MNNGLGCIDGLGSVDWGCVVNWLSMAISYWSWGVTINTSMNWSCCNCMMDSNGSCMVNGDSSISIGVSSDCQSNCSYYKIFQCHVRRVLYSMPDQYKCDSCKVVAYHVSQ